MVFFVDIFCVWTICPFCDIFPLLALRPKVVYSERQPQPDQVSSFPRGDWRDAKFDPGIARAWCAAIEPSHPTWIHTGCL
jgi:hypothetical protein